MYSSRCVFMLLVLLVVFHCSEASSSSTSSSENSSTKSGSTCAECSVCLPRLCSYSNVKCYKVFNIPEANKTDIFIDGEFELPLDESLLVCQAACTANVDCKEALYKRTFTSSATFEHTCILSKLPAFRIAGTVDNAELILCDGLKPVWGSMLYFPFTVARCI